MSPGETSTGADLASHAAVLEREIEWFREVLDHRMRLHGGEEGLEPDPLAACPPPALPPTGSPYAEVARGLGLGAAERLVLILAFLPHLQPEVLDPFFIHNRGLDRRFTEFGGLVGQSHGGFLPTAETAMYLLAGHRLEARLRYHDLFQNEHPLYLENLLRLQRRHRDEPALASILEVSPEGVERLTTGRPYHPPFSAEFPAQRITTPYEWDDLVLEPASREEIHGLLAWIRHERDLMEGWGLAQRLKPGFRALFHGPPGTGKTLTASLLGKETDLPVYRIDLSKVISKYIGETEKNLANLFDQARHRSWILFFDEADSIFGARTESRTANDRAANQQIAYLLQRIEDFPGVVLLATNLRAHLDEAFIRRFQAMIHFPIPEPAQRLRLWRDNFLDKPYPLAPDVDLAELARRYELSGGGIINVLRFACLRAVTRDPPEIRASDLARGIRRELHKAGDLAS